jgi:hypothetical protein
VIAASLTDLHSRLYEGYASQHVGSGDETAALVYQRDIRPLLAPPAADLIADIGFCRDGLVRLLQAGVRGSPHDARAHRGPENLA